jgi:hypothetical protein
MFSRPRLLVVNSDRGIVLAAAVGGVLTLVAMSDRQAWEGVWPATVNELGISMVLAAPVAAAGAGWIGSSNKRAGLDDLAAASTRSIMQVRGRLVAETMYWVALGYLSALSACGGLTARLATWWKFPVLMAASQFSFLLLFVVLGLLAGRFLSPWLTIPLLGAGSYVVLAFLLVSGGSSLEWLSPVDNRTSILLVADGVVLSARALWLLVLAVALVAMWCRSRNFALVSWWITGLAVSPLLLVGSADRHLDFAAAHPSCTLASDESVGACYPRVKAFNNHVVVGELSRIQALVPALLPGTTCFLSDEAVGYSPVYDRSFDRTCADLGRPDVTVYLSSRVFDTSSYAQVPAEQFTVAMVLSLVPPSAAPLSADDSVGERPEASASDYLQRWLLSHLGVDLEQEDAFYLPRVSSTYLDYSGNEPAIKWFEGLSASARTAWVTAHREHITEGTVTWAEFA